MRGRKEDIYNVDLRVWDSEEKIGELMFDVFADISEGGTFEVPCLYFWPTNDSERNPSPRDSL